MPTYQYACTACQHELEAVQSFSDAALTECPECGGKLRKVSGAVGVVFKGSGFYKTDSRKAEKSSAPAASSSSTSSSDSSSSSSSSTPAPASTPASTPSTSSTSTPAAKSA